jgi:hypothetical protein
MPEVNQVTEQQVREAAEAFYPDFLKVVGFHNRINELWPYRGKSAEFDQGLERIIERQKGLMFELRNLYAEAYDLLPEDKRAAVFRWIVQATGELSRMETGLASLGIAPVIIVAGVIIAAATAGALVAWHREISNQEKALENQARLIPLVESGVVSPDVLKPVDTGGSVLGTISNLGNMLLFGVMVWAAVKLFGESR